MKEKVKIPYDSVYKEMFTYLGKYHLISEELSEAIYEVSTVVEFKKGELLLAENRDCNSLYFIVRGFCSCYYGKEGKDCIMGFAREGDFCVSYHSFLGRRKSLFSIKATEDTTAVSISRENFENLWLKYSEFISLFCIILESIVIENEEKMYIMRSNKAEGRVKHYMGTRDIQFLLKHVPQYSIASFLDMTPETFAKIFGRLNKEM